MKVNLIYEVNNREYYNCVLLERELVRRGHTVKILNKTEDIVVCNDKTITLLPNSYRNEDYEYYDFVFNIHNNPVAIYPCEQVTNHILPKFFDYSEENIVKRIPHLCWGSDYYEFIKELGYTCSDNMITGPIQMDFCRPEFRSLYKGKDVLSNEYNIPVDKQWILFISDFAFDNIKIVNQIVQSGDQNREAILDRHRSSRKASTEILKWFEKFLISNDNYIIIYRKHPVEILNNDVLEISRNYPDRFFTISDYNIKEWIIACDRIANWYSTAVVECLAEKKKIALLRPFEIEDKPWFKDYPFYITYPKIKNYGEFVDAMISGEADYNEQTIAEIKKLYDIGEIPSFIRIADALEYIYSNWNSDNKKSIMSFTYNRFAYLLYNKLIFKSIIKKTYQSLHKVFGFDLTKYARIHFAFDEWNASADNKYYHDELAGKIDCILNKYYKKQEGD